MPRIQIEPKKALNDAVPGVRLSVIEDIATEPGPEAVEMLTLALSDSSVSVAARAGETLGNLYLKGLVPAETMIEKAKDSSIGFKARMGIISGLSKKPDPQAVEFLKQLMKSGSAEERRIAAGMIGYQGVDVAVPALLDALGDMDESVRYNVEEALNRISRGQDFGQDQKKWAAWWNTYTSRRQ